MSMVCYNIYIIRYYLQVLPQLFCFVGPFITYTTKIFWKSVLLNLFINLLTSFPKFIKLRIFCIIKFRKKTSPCARQSTKWFFCYDFLSVSTVQTHYNKIIVFNLQNVCFQVQTLKKSFLKKFIRFPFPFHTTTAVSLNCWLILSCWIFRISQESNLIKFFNLKFILCECIKQLQKKVLVFVSMSKRNIFR